MSTARLGPLTGRWNARWRRSAVDAAASGIWIVVVLGVLVVAHSRSSSLGFSGSQTPPEFATIELTAAAALLSTTAVALLRTGRRRHAIVVLLLALSQFPLALNAPSDAGTPVPPLGNALRWAFVVLVAALVLAYPADRLSRRHRCLVAGLAGVLVAVPSLDPVATDLGLARPSAGLVTWCGIVGTLALVIAVLLRVAGVAGVARPALLPLALVAAALGLAAGGSTAVTAAGLDDQAVLLQNAQNVMLSLLPLALLAEILLRRWAVAAVSREVPLAVRAGDPAMLVAALRRCLHDRRLTVWLAGRGDDDWLDAQPDGLRTAVPDVAKGRRRCVISGGDSERIALLDVDIAAADGDPQLLAAVVSAARVGLENARLDAQIAQQRAQLERSRQRVLQAISRQRVELRRDLAQGPRRELEAVGTHLQAARLVVTAPVPPPDAVSGARRSIAQARTGLSLAVAGIRVLARGIYPPVLTQSGLSVALRALREQASLDVRLALDPALEETRLRPAVESTAYFIAADGMRVASTLGVGSCTVSTRLEGRDLLLTMACGAGEGFRPDQPIPELRAAQDRVEALGGTFHTNAGPGPGFVVRARIPRG